MMLKQLRSKKWTYVRYTLEFRNWLDLFIKPSLLVSEFAQAKYVTTSFNSK